MTKVWFVRLSSLDSDGKERTEFEVELPVGAVVFAVKKNKGSIAFFYEMQVGETRTQKISLLVLTEPDKTLRLLVESHTFGKHVYVYQR